MSDDRILIPQIPSTVDERRTAIETALRQRYPALAIRVDLAGDVYSIVASSAAGSFTEEASVYDSAVRTVARLRSYFTDLAADTDTAGREFAGRTDVRGDEARGESGYLD